MIIIVPLSKIHAQILLYTMIEKLHIDCSCTFVMKRRYEDGEVKQSSKKLCLKVGIASMKCLRNCETHQNGTSKVSNEESHADAKLNQ